MGGRSLNRLSHLRVLSSVLTLKGREYHAKPIATLLQNNNALLSACNHLPSTSISKRLESHLSNIYLQGVMALASEHEGEAKPGQAQSSRA